MNQVKGSKQAVQVPEVPRVPVHPPSAVLASPGPHTAENECQHEAVTYQEDLLQPPKGKKKRFRCVKVQGDGASGLRELQQTPAQSKAKSCSRQVLTEHTRRAAHWRQCLQSRPREVNMPNHPCAPQKTHRTYRNTETSIQA